MSGRVGPGTEGTGGQSLVSRAYGLATRTAPEANWTVTVCGVVAMTAPRPCRTWDTRSPTEYVSTSWTGSGRKGLVAR